MFSFSERAAEVRVPIGTKRASRIAPKGDASDAFLPL